MNTTRRAFLKTAGSAVALGCASRLAIPGTALGATSGADDLCFEKAHELARLIRKGKLSAREVMSAYLQQINRLNPRITAIVARLDDAQCLALADAADQRRARGEPLPALHGLPIAVKDTEPVMGFPFTRGSTIFRNDMPAADSVIVERLRKAGALIIGKTNMPEFGMGSHTYNKVYGTTLNPYDLTKSAGGSSGGAGAALAAGLLPIANGSDLAGSLRNPGNFNNIVGFRPSLGLVPNTPNSIPFGNLTVKGPMGRTVEDVAFLLAVIAGNDERDPGSYGSDPTTFLRPLKRDLKGARVAWSLDLGGLPLHPDVRAVLEKQRTTFEQLGCVVLDAHPDLSGADEAFLTLRAWRSWNNYGPLLAKHRTEMKPEAVGEIEAGAKLSLTDVTKAMTVQAEIMDRMRVFHQKCEFLLCAVNQLPPFDASLDWPKEIAGVKMDHYIAWMKSAYWISMTGCPAISVPAGFTPEGLPVGIQMVGRYHADFELLQFAHSFEQATNFWKRRPTISA